MGTTIKHSHGVTSIAFTADGQFFATADTHGRVELRDGQTGARVKEDSRGPLSDEDLRDGFYQVSAGSQMVTSSSSLRPTEASIVLPVITFICVQCLRS